MGQATAPANNNRRDRLVMFHSNIQAYPTIHDNQPSSTWRMGTKVERRGECLRGSVVNDHLKLPRLRAGNLCLRWKINGERELPRADSPQPPREVQHAKEGVCELDRSILPTGKPPWI